jgi:integrase
MAKVKKHNLATPTSRKRLAPREQAYFQKIAKGLFIGYRKRSADQPGTWVVKALLYPGQGQRAYKTKSFATADDHAPSNATTVLNAQQATSAASTYDAWDDAARSHDPKAITVAEALGTHWREWMKLNRPRSASSVNAMLDNHLLPALGSVPISRLTSTMIETWKNSMATKPKHYAGDGFRAPRTLDEKQSRQSTANTHLAWCKSGLNWCKRQKLIDCTDDAWRWVQSFKNVSRSSRRGRDPYLETPQDIQTFLDGAREVCEDFHRLCTGALLLGARYGELRQLKVKHFKAHRRAIEIESTQTAPTKTKQGRLIKLGDAGMAFFELITAGRHREEFVFTHTYNGRPDQQWDRNHTQRPMRETCERSGFNLSFNNLRHSWASHAKLNGMSDLALMQQGGWTSMEMVLSHYGHLSEQHIEAQAIKCEVQLEPAAPADSDDADATTLH